ncbi:hypothetical protein [Dankookia sp. P2]|uniref:hypothetical protein n=1 Tax=Dankookia sp. P2 TaxID=3423955 RepID=UPI003D66BB83
MPYPPAARERMLRIVLAEWAEWGHLTVTPGQRPPSSRAESEPANFPASSPIGGPCRRTKARSR